VWLDRESRAEPGVDHLKLRQLGEDAVMARDRADPFSLVWP
jgi:hypothetical protein